MTDIILESVRAVVLTVIVMFLWSTGQERFAQTRKGWNLIIIGFGLLLFGSVLDISDNFESLNPFIVIGDTETEAFFEKFVGFLGGFFFLAIGLFSWIPGVQGLSDLVDTRTRDLQEVNQSLVSEIEDRERIEATLRQAQKMEAVGQLTGGVAHDFNNLLAVVLGNAELLGDEIGDNHLLASIDRAATRGAELTQRLLAFSRQQALQPQSIDLTELVSGLHDLLHCTLGKPVKMLTHVPEETWPVLADPGQLENALLNLSINARDAMPGGGILEIRCSNIELQEGDLRVSDEVAAGDYVQIAVRDTGAGMPEDVLEHAFEPFYTTKDVGEGSGLGLSMVYGFARQSGGDAVIESEPGTGTEVRLFLPRSKVTTASDERAQDADLKRGQGEVILVLEDDPDVRSFAVGALEGLNYRVREAADANAAMKLLEEEADNLDLLLSDVVLPGVVSGPELAAKAKDLYPKLKLVFMSGYAADLYTCDKIPGFDETLLTKPFRLAELAKVIRDTLAA